MYVTKFFMSGGKALQLSRVEDYKLACAGLRDGAFVFQEGNEAHPITAMFDNFIFRVGDYVRFRGDAENKDGTYFVFSLDAIMHTASLRPVAQKQDSSLETIVSLEKIIPIAK